MVLRKRSFSEILCMVFNDAIDINNGCKLFDGDGFGEVAGLVHVAAAKDGNMVGQQL